ncbi:DNA polymerase III subunit delta [Flavisphingomonas formosensis]|uniref:DNA polymerase III subunit delta n=1 Tax=Flavisphingomonas formosensis TaxID=861534 RepID=UPI0012FA6771|nr:DNA polymerase III subunit delta [Sphingomonas formosensis]
MKANKGQIERALDSADPNIRLFLLYGPDESGSRALAERLARKMGTDAERVDFIGPQLKADPAILSDEAASISLFGGPRWIRVESAGDESLEAVQGVIGQTTASFNPIVMIAGALRKDSKLLKAALDADAVMAFASYVPEGADAGRIVLEMARAAGLQMAPDLARRIADSTGGDRALMAGEIEKLALYVDAAPDRPRDIDQDAFAALGADASEGSQARFVDAALEGRSDIVEEELGRLAEEGIEGIPLVRAMLRRLLLLAELRAQVERGNAIAAVMATSGKSLFWKDKDVVARQLGHWTSDHLRRAIDRMTQAERKLKASGGPGEIVAREEFHALARAGARLR